MSIPDPASLTPVMDGDAGIVTPIGFPHGLRCMTCSEVIPNGDAYVSAPCGYVQYEIRCAHCGLLEVS